MNIVPSIHRQCQLNSIATDIAIRFSTDNMPNMYDVEEAFRLHGVYLDKVSIEELNFFNQELQKLLGKSIIF